VAKFMTVVESFLLILFWATFGLSLHASQVITKSKCSGLLSAPAASFSRNDAAVIQDDPEWRDLAARIPIEADLNVHSVNSATRTESEAQFRARVEEKQDIVVEEAGGKIVSDKQSVASFGFMFCDAMLVKSKALGKLGLFHVRFGLSEWQSKLLLSAFLATDTEVILFGNDLSLAAGMNRQIEGLKAKGFTNIKVVKVPEAKRWNFRYDPKNVVAEYNSTSSQTIGVTLE
jgi:hypothetical protein